MKIVLIVVLVLSGLPGTGQKLCNPDLDSVKIIKSADFVSLIDTIQVLHFSSKNNKRAIPKFIRRALGCWRKGKFRIVNPGKFYNNSDAIIGHRPTRQLGYFGLNEKFILLSYNHGGIGLHGHIFIIKYSNKVIEKIWGIYGMGNSKEDIILYLKRIEETKRLNTGYSEF